MLTELYRTFKINWHNAFKSVSANLCLSHLLFFSFFPPCRSLRTLIQRYLPSMMSQMSKFLSSLVFRSTLPRKSILLCCTWFFIDSPVFTLLSRFLCFFIAQKTNKIPVFFRKFILINDPCSSSVYARKQKRDGFMCKMPNCIVFNLLERAACSKTK